MSSAAITRRTATMVRTRSVVPTAAAALFVGRRCATTTAFSTTTTTTTTTTSLLQDPSLLPTLDNTADTFDVYNPAKPDEIVGRVPNKNQQDAHEAIEASAQALPLWRDGTTGQHRSNLLQKWSQLIKENANDIATIMTLESGKPLKESLGEVNYGVSFLDYYAGEAIRPSSAGGGFMVPTPFTFAENNKPRGQVLAKHQAVGVTAMITPWNFPMAMITRKVGPALAAGCTSVVKPSELTPLTAMALTTLAHRAGISPDVLQLITCNKDNTPEIGNEFCQNLEVKKISFTGSTPVGKKLMKLSSDSIKRLSLELGGNAPFVVFDDANINQAVAAAMASKFRNAGQTCVCADRFLIHSNIHDDFVDKLVQATQQLVVGDGLDGSTTMGPLITAEAVTSVHEKVQQAVEQGAKCELGGTSTLTNQLGPHFYEPTILTNVSPKSRIFNTETFGPVAAIAKFDVEDEALQICNDSNVGLASYFCSRDTSRIFRFSQSLECGIVGVNDGIISSCAAPFGGVKESGLGREGSALGIAEYLETKYVFLNV